MSGSGLLSEWVRWVWIAVYAVIVVLHVFHAKNRIGQGRTWHSGHVVMALGMVYMFMPSRLKMIPDRAWEMIFAAVAVAILLWMLRAWTSCRAVNFLWAVSLLDMATMVYMFAMPGVALAPLTYLLVVYYAGMMVAWLAGAFDDDGGRGGLLPLALTPRPSSAPVAALAGATSVELRTSLGAMAAGMGYMFIGMQVGM